MSDSILSLLKTALVPKNKLGNSPTIKDFNMTLLKATDKFLKDFLKELSGDTEFLELSEKLKQRGKGYKKAVSTLHDKIQEKFNKKLETTKSLGGRFLRKLFYLNSAVRSYFMHYSLYPLSLPLLSPSLSNSMAKDLHKHAVGYMDDYDGFCNTFLKNNANIAKAGKSSAACSAGKKIKQAARKLSGGAKWVGKKTAEEGGEGFFRRARRVLTEAGEFVTENLPKWARRIRP